MQFTTLTIENCMKIFGFNGQEKYWPTASDWDETITCSGYLESEVYNGMFK